jgi:Bacteriophage T4-like portal protein (Gp20)
VGYISDVAGRIRDFLRGDKEQLAIQMAKGTSASGYPQTGYDLLQAYGYDVLSDYLRLEHDLLSRYVDYEEMDDYPEVSAAVDIYADDASQPETQINRSVWIDAQDEGIQQVLDDLFHKTLRMDEEVWEIARTLVKYGNDFEELLVTHEGVRGFNFLPPPTVRRIEGPRGELFGFVQDFKGKFGYSPQEFQNIIATRAASRQGGSDKQGYGGLDKVAALEDWEVVHFRLRGKHRRSIYGYSVLESARWIWKRLMLLEDAALIYRLQRAPERYAFYVDVGDLPPAEALAFVNRVRQQHKKTKFFNPTTGKLDLKFNPMSQDEDFFVPVRKGTEGARIEVLGAPSWQHMDDIEYFRDKLFAALKVPKAYMGQEEGVARAVLSSEDVRFARTVLRVQRELRNGFAKVCRVHLSALNIDPYATDYDVKMTVPSAIFELAQLEVRNARADLAGRMKEFVSLHWILSNVFGLNDADIEKIVGQRTDDAIKEQVDGAKGQMAAQELMQPQGQEQQPQEGEPNGPPAPQAPAEPDEGAEMASPEDARASMGRFAAAMRHRSGERAARRGSRGNRISEEDLFKYQNRQTEKRASDKLEQLLKNDKAFAKRLADIGSMLHEIGAVNSARRH